MPAAASSLVDRFVPPGDREAGVPTVQARVFVGYLLAVLVTSPLVLGVGLLTPGWEALAMGATGVAANALALLLYRRGLPRTVGGHLSLGAGTAALTVYAATNGGVLSPWAAIFGLVPLAAHVLLGVRGALVWAGLVAGILFALGALAPAVPGEVLPSTLTLVVLTVFSGAFAVLFASMETIRQRDLREARDAARAASDAKSRFLAHMSHELRTPMNGVLGLTELLLLDQRLHEDQRERLQAVHHSGSALVGLLNDLLDLASVEAGRLRLDPAPLAVDTLLSELDGLFGEVTRRRGVDFVVDCAPDVPEAVVADRARMLQVLCNFVGNAVKFTTAGEIRVELRRSPAAPSSPEGLRFAVCDTGPGIAPERRALLFQPFSQADPTLARTHGGTGLGLSISRSLVEAMGGTVGVESVPGVGSTFHFTVPAPVVASPGPGPRLAPGGAPPSWAGEGHVLIVEDQPVNQVVARMMVEQLGFTSELVSDGAVALGRIRERQDWAFVLMDWQLPTMDGAEVTRRVRADGRALPIVGLTAHAGADDRALAVDAGMDACLAKPVRLATLGETLHRLGLVALRG